MYPVYLYYGMMKETKNVPIAFPPQEQPRQPGFEYKMNPLLIP
ncbi:hypothetical protein [Robertmurraya sp. P23]